MNLGTKLNKRGNEEKLRVVSVDEWRKHFSWFSTDLFPIKNVTQKPQHTKTWAHTGFK